MAGQETQDWRQALVNIAEGIKAEIEKDRAELNRLLISIGESCRNGEEKHIPASEIARAKRLMARLEALSWCYQLPVGYLGGMFVAKKPEPPTSQ